MTESIEFEIRNIGNIVMFSIFILDAIYIFYIIWKQRNRKWFCFLFPSIRKRHEAIFAVFLQFLHKFILPPPPSSQTTFDIVTSFSNYNLRNHNVVKHSLVEKRIFWGLYDFLHQHRPTWKSYKIHVHFL